MNFSENHISNTLKRINQLSLMMKESFGPNGKTILFELNGSVLTSQDGSEILSIVHLADPVANLIAQGVISSATEYGDGSKLFTILSHSLLANLDKIIDDIQESKRRRKMICCLIQLSCKVIPYLKDCLSRSNTSFFRIDTENKGRISGAINALLVTKFSKGVSRTLAQVISSFLVLCPQGLSLQERLEKLVCEPSLCIVEIPDLPVHQSKIIEGFIITRNFKYLKDYNCLNDCSFILWSCGIEFNREDFEGKVRVDDAEQLENTYFFQMNLLTKTMNTLADKNVSLIISSVYFPDWAIPVCRRFGISVVDMVDSKEFEYLSHAFKLSYLSSHSEVEFFDQVGRETFQRFQVGSSKFIKVFGKSQQMLLCAPTLSQCRQYAKASSQVLTYFLNWMKDSKNHERHLPETSVVDDEALKLYYIQCGHYNTLEIYNLIKTAPMSHLEVEKKVLLDTLQEVLHVHYTKRAKHSDGTFLNFLASREDRSASQCCSEEEKSSQEQTAENPFLMLKILTRVVESLKQVLKIEHIIKSRVPLKTMYQNSRGESDEDE